MVSEQALESAAITDALRHDSRGDTATDGELENINARPPWRACRDRRRRLLLDRPLELLTILQQRVRAVGVAPRYDTVIQSVDDSQATI